MEHTDIVNFILLPLLIFGARVADVTLGTMKVIYVTQGSRLIASALGFFETLIWLVAINQVMSNLTSWTCYAAWALGYSTGIFVGITVVKFLGRNKVSALSNNNIFAPWMLMKK